jgi:hypothetical protein
MPIEQEQKFTGTEPTISAEHIEEARVKYNEVTEAFLDSIFGADSTKTYREWIKAVSTNKS